MDGDQEHNQKLVGVSALIIGHPDDGEVKHQQMRRTYSHSYRYD